MADYDLQYQDTHIDALLATANELKTAGYIYKGVATPSTNPGTPTERVAYLASEPGTYTNFGGIVIASGLYSLTYAGGTWTGTQMSAGSDIDVVQTTGQSTSDVMSQKAVTEELNNLSSNLQDVECMINFNGVGTGASTFVNTELKPIKKGNYTIKVNGSISKANNVSNTSPYFRIDFYAADQTTLVKYIYMVCQQSGGSYTADYIDYGATITEKTMEVEIPQDGYVRVVHRITTSSYFTVVVSQLAAVKDVLNEEVYTNYPLTQQRVIQGTYRSYYSDIVVRTTRVMAFLDVSNIKSVKITPASGFTFSLATFSKNYMNAQVGDVIPTDMRTYYDAEYVNTGRTTQLTDNDKTLFVIIAKSDGSDIDVSTITDDVLTIECAVDKKRLQDEVNANKKKANVLFIGNSLLQDAVAYLPLYMKELAPNVDFNFYLWYNSGYHLSQQLADFNNNVAADIFSVNVGAGWMQHPDSKTMAQVLSEYEFDIVVIQEYFYYFYANNLPYTDNDLQVFFDTITWIEDHYNKPFKVATFFHPPRLTDQATADASFTFEKDNIVKILQKTTVESMLTSGIAIYRAMATSLDSLGDTGHLSADNVHSQEGLPCMLTAWTSALWLMEEMGVPMSVNNVQTIVDSSNYASINVPGPNLGSGLVIGTTAQVRLAQQVAIKAYKEGKALFNANLTEYT